MCRLNRKLNVVLMLPVYLKTRGVDPLTHPVMQQMVSYVRRGEMNTFAHRNPQGEVKKYFDKIKEAEDPAKSKPLATDCPSVNAIEPTD